MATTRTRSELVNQALANLGVLDAGQTPEIEDANTVDDHVDTVLAELSAKDIVSIPDDDAIPVALFNVLADLLALDCGPDFHKPSDPRAKLIAENTIRVMVRVRPTYEPQQTDYM